MFKLIIFLVVGLLTIPHIRIGAQETSTTTTDETTTITTDTTDTTTSVTTDTTTTDTTDTTTTNTDTTTTNTDTTTTITDTTTTYTDTTTTNTDTTTTNTDTTTTNSDTTTADTETTTETTVVTITDTTITATTEATTTTAIISTTSPILPFFQCSFSADCFGKNQIILTNGNEFNPTDISGVLEEPRAPTSDVTSITQPTSGSTQKCNLPYQIDINNGTDKANWDMWFCFNNQCPISNNSFATCTLGEYGLISIDPSETSKKVNDSIISNTILRDAVGEQCIRFYYYITVYDKEDWGQRIQLSIKPNDVNINEFSIKNFTVNDITSNSWHFYNATFNSSFSDYELVFLFEVNQANRTDDPKTNKTIYFALDNIDIYDYNCDVVASSMPSTTPSIPTNTTMTQEPPSEEKPNLALILGLSLGIGIPVLAGIIGGLIYYFKVYKPKRKVAPKKDTSNTTTAAVTDIPLAPTKKTNADSAIGNVVV